MGASTRHQIQLEAVLAAAILWLALVACSGGTEGQAAFQGTTLGDSTPATPFQLQNHLGDTVSLSDFRGKVVLLTFLYTNCPDVCPANTSQLKGVQQLFGDGMSGEVAFLAVSVDPERDDSESAQSFIEKWQLDGNWDFLVGSREELEPVWKSYFVGTGINLRDAGDNVHVHLDGSVHVHEGIALTGGVDGLRQGILETNGANGGAPEPIDASDPENRYLVIHSAPVFLIDREGRLRVVHTQPLEPEAIAQDIKLLAK
ncbi:MAG: SCO family protein [Chloroflexi bacterium]|nr:SCO family protein [Chloroflexota bacterium]